MKGKNYLAQKYLAGENIREFGVKTYYNFEFEERIIEIPIRRRG